MKAISEYVVRVKCVSRVGETSTQNVKRRREGVELKMEVKMTVSGWASAEADLESEVGIKATFWR